VDNLRAYRDGRRLNNVVDWANGYWRWPAAAGSAHAAGLPTRALAVFAGSVE